MAAKKKSPVKKKAPAPKSKEVDHVTPLLQIAQGGNSPSGALDELNSYLSGKDLSHPVLQKVHAIANEPASNTEKREKIREHLLTV